MAEASDIRFSLVPMGSTVETKARYLQTHPMSKKIYLTKSSTRPGCNVRVGCGSTPTSVSTGKNPTHRRWRTPDGKLGASRTACFRGGVLIEAKPRVSNKVLPRSHLAQDCLFVLVAEWPKHWIDAAYSTARRLRLAYRPSVKARSAVTSIPERASSNWIPVAWDTQWADHLVSG
jgi:hypothetical protein